MRTTVWSDYADLHPRLVQLVLDGHTSSEIARQLNLEFGISLSREAVMGRIHRYGLKLAASTGGLKQPRVPKPPKVKLLRPRVERAAVPEATRQELLATPPLSIEEGGGRMTSGCHWPYGDPQDADFTFCGRPRADQSPPYCEIHLQCMCQTPLQRARKAMWDADPKRRALASRRMLNLKERVA